MLLDFVPKSSTLYTYYVSKLGNTEASASVDVTLTATTYSNAPGVSTNRLIFHNICWFELAVFGVLLASCWIKSTRSRCSIRECMRVGETSEVYEPWLILIQMRFLYY